MRVSDLQGIDGPGAQELGDRCFPGLGELDEKAQARQVGGELVVVEQRPAQDLAALVIALRSELAGDLGEIVEDDAGLREFSLAMFQHRNLAHGVDLRAVIR